MKNRFFKSISLIILSTAFTTPFCNPRQKLEQITSEVNNTQQQLFKLTTQRQQFFLKLQEIEVKYGHLKNAYDKTQTTMSNLQSQINQLDQQQTQLINQLNKQYEALNQQLRAVYALGREPLFKILLSNEDPNTISRQQTYLSYLSTEQANFIQSIKKTNQDLQNTKQQLHQQKEQLKQLAQEQQARLTPITQLMNQRNNTVAALDAALQSKQLQLQQLINNQQKLTQALANLRAKQSLNAIEHQSFSKLQHYLPWPVQGKIIQTYKSPINGNKILSDGIVIAAAAGTPIKVIAPGRVAFSAWMPGYGIVIIVQHSHGYMSIYGHSQAVFKPVGAIVSTGDIIASVGNSGGHYQSGLYFELRKNAQPLNPNAWLQT